MVTVSPPAKTKATAWLRSPVMRDAAATCEIRAWYHLSGSGEGSHGRALGHREATMGSVGRDLAVCPHSRDRVTGTARQVLAILLTSSRLHRQSW